MSAQCRHSAPAPALVSMLYSYSHMVPPLLLNYAQIILCIDYLSTDYL